MTYIKISITTSLIIYLTSSFLYLDFYFFSNWLEFLIESLNNRVFILLVLFSKIIIDLGIKMLINDIKLNK